MRNISDLVNHLYNKIINRFFYSKKSKKEVDKFPNWIIYFGFFSTIIGISSLYLFPETFFINQLVIIGKESISGITVFGFTLFSWVLLLYGILNKVDYSRFENNKTKWLKIFHLRKLDIKTNIVIYATLLFVSINIAVFLSINPHKRNQEFEDSFNKSIDNFYEKIEQYEKSLDTLKK